MYQKGYRHTEEEKEKIRQSKLGANNPNFGKKLSDETRTKMSVSRTGVKRYRSPELIERHRQSLKQYYQSPKGLAMREHLREKSKGNISHLGFKNSPESIGKMKCAKQGKQMPLVTKLKHSKRQTKLWSNPAYKKMISDTHKEQWKDPEYIANVFKGMKESLNQRPNGCEIIIAGMLDEIQPNTWEYVGDRDLAIGRKNPDFWNGDHKLIEHFGDYWHGPKARCYEETEKGRIEFFTKHGYKVLIIWEHDLKKHPDLVREKIREFVNK